MQRETAESIDLSNGITLEILAASWKTTRGYTIVAALLDEAAFWESAEGAANLDQEILDALRPAQATVAGAKLLVGSSPHGKRGILWAAYKRWYGIDGAGALIWQSSTADMNGTVKPSIIERALALDEAKARAEFFAEFRDDTGLLLTEELVSAAVDDEIAVRPAREGVEYRSFIDSASGVAGGDAFAVSVAHAEGEVIFVDLVYERTPPFDPVAVLREVKDILSPYRLGAGPLWGDHYSANWPVSAAAGLGIDYRHSTRDRSTIFVECLPLFSSGRIRLPKSDRLVRQLLSLERKATGGRDSVDIPRSAGLLHGDLANAVAGAAVLAAERGVEIPICGPILLTGAAPPHDPLLGGGFDRMRAADWEIPRGGW